MPNFFSESENSAALSDYLKLHSLALAIADHAARSEIELYSLQTSDPSGRRLFDTSKPREESVDQESLSIVDKAVQYIELRGSALPFRLNRSGDMVWFEEASSAKVALAG